MTSATILGIDPGLNGALAVWRPLGPDQTTTLAVWDMPTRPHSTTEKRIRKVLDVPELHSILLAIADEYHPITAVVEDVNAFRGAANTSSFTFGYGAGVLHGILIALDVPIRLVKPAAWKLSLGLSANKDDSRKMADRIFGPLHSGLWFRKKDDGRAEAALLAYYGAKGT